MKISGLIEELKKAIEQYGDIDVCSVDEQGYNEINPDSWFLNPNRSPGNPELVL